MMMTVLARMAVAMMMSDHLWCSVMLDAFVSDFAQMLFICFFVPWMLEDVILNYGFDFNFGGYNFVPERVALFQPV